MKRIGHVIWLFGLSGAGKSTLAAALQDELFRRSSINVLMLDGDQLRNGLCRGLGFTDMGREENLRRAAEVARIGIESGLVVIAAFITPREQHREMIRSIVGKNNLSLVHLAASLEVCRNRDVKGLYARSVSGHISLMTGIDSHFDEPTHFDLRIDTTTRSVGDCLVILAGFACQLLSKKNII